MICFTDIGLLLINSSVPQTSSNEVYQSRSSRFERMRWRFICCQINDKTSPNPWMRPILLFAWYSSHLGEVSLGHHIYSGYEPGSPSESDLMYYMSCDLVWYGLLRFWKVAAAISSTSRLVIVELIAEHSPTTSLSIIRSDRPDPETHFPAAGKLHLSKLRYNTQAARCDIR